MSKFYLAQINRYNTLIKENLLIYNKSKQQRSSENVIKK